MHSITYVEWLEEYNKKLEAHGNKLMLEGVNEQVMEVLDKTGLVEEIGADYIFEESPKRGEAFEAARQKAREWISANKT